MNGRKLFREYAQSKGLEAAQFVRIKSEMYQNDVLVTRNNSGAEERSSLNYKEMIYWIIKTK